MITTFRPLRLQACCISTETLRRAWGESAGAVLTIKALVIYLLWADRSKSNIDTNIGIGIGSIIFFNISRHQLKTLLFSSWTAHFAPPPLCCRNVTWLSGAESRMFCWRRTQSLIILEKMWSAIRSNFTAADRNDSSLLRQHFRTLQIYRRFKTYSCESESGTFSSSLGEIGSNSCSFNANGNVQTSTHEEQKYDEIIIGKIWAWVYQSIYVC